MRFLLIRLYLACAFVAVFAAEGYLTLAPSNLSKQNVLMVLQKDGREAFPAVPPSTWYFENFRAEIDSGRMPLAFSGVANARTVYCREKDGWIVYRSDANGFRNERHTDTALIGDSFVQGSCLTRDLASLTGATSFGMGGNGPMFDLATLVEYALPAKPRAVVWAYYAGNDLEDLKREITSPRLMAYMDGRAKGIDQSAIDASLRKGIAALDDKWREFLTLGHIRTSLGLRGIMRPAYSAPALEMLPVLEKVLTVAVAATKNAEARFLFFYIPSPDRMDDPSGAILEAARNAGAEIVAVDWGKDADRFFEPFPGRYGHWNAAGNQHAAEAIHRAIGE